MYACYADIASVKMKHGVGAEELTVQEAAVGSFTLQFELLTRLTGQKHTYTAFE